MERLDYGKMSYGCKHYRRRCMIRAPCCNEIYGCRHCHNEATNMLNSPSDRHDLVRYDVKQVICLVCDTEQPAAHLCTNCGVNMGEYYCEICKFYDDDTHKQQFHCDDCGICRVGGRENFFHCKKCGGRIPLGLKSKSLRVLVTGGSGFVGSHLVDRLMARGDYVIVVDNFFTGRKENVLHHLRNPRFELIRHDVVEPILLEVDQIYHLACPASPVHYKYNPVKTIKTNVVGTLNMLGLAKRINARFLLTSTSEVYGDPLEHPQVETYWGNVNPIGVRSCYDEGKRVAETLTMDYHRGLNIEVRIARIFNTYGPRMCLDDGRVVSNFVAQALRKEPMTVYGDGKQTRSFQYVSDLVEGLMRLMEGEHVGPFNLGNPGEFTMLELAKVVQDTIDSNAKIEFRPNTEDDPHKRKPDISRAKELLGWQPVVPLREGLPMMVSDFRQRIFGDLKDGGSSTSKFSSV